MSDSSEDEMYLAAAACTTLLSMVLVQKRKKKSRKLWARKWLQRREENRGVLGLLNNELLTEDPSSYANFLRLDSDLFKTLFSAVKKDITLSDTCMRESISAQSRLQVTLRFLATGEL